MSSISQSGAKVSGYTRHEGSSWIDEHRTHLPDNHWVAANASGLVAKDPTIDGLMSQIQARHLDPTDLAIAFITSDSA
jgi:hypothetical protein